MKTLSSILKILMSELHINESELARQTGVAQPVIHRICSGETDNPKVGTLKPLANYFSLSISQLIGDQPLPNNRIPGTYSPGARGWQQIPLLDWEEILHWPNFRSADHSKSLPAISVDLELNEHAYALNVPDSDFEPRFPQGAILVFDPSLKPNNRDFVIIRVENQSIPSFKQLLMDGDYLYLKPINPDFKTMLLDKPHQFLGVMVQSRMDFKK